MYPYPYVYPAGQGYPISVPGTLSNQALKANIGQVVAHQQVPTIPQQQTGAPVSWEQRFMRDLGVDCNFIMSQTWGVKQAYLLGWLRQQGIQNVTPHDLNIMTAYLCGACGIACLTPDEVLYIRQRLG
jgi:hypothetical protein